MDYGQRQRDDGLRITVENRDFYRRDRSPSPRNQFRHEGGRRRSFSPDRENQSYYRDRDEPRNRGWMREQEDKSPPRKSPERYSSSWRRNSLERSPNRKGPSKGRNFFDRSRSRSRSRRRSRKSRSRSSSRGRSRYRDSRSPRRRSPRNSSGSYGVRKKMKRSSSSSGSSSRDSRSPSIDSKRKNKDDFFKAMYSKKDEKESESEDGGYLHPVLDRGPKNQQNEPIRPAVNNNMLPMQAAEKSHLAPNAASLAALSQAYGNSPPKKTYTQQEIDDEDRFLYGDEAPPPRVEEKPKFVNTLQSQLPSVQPPPQKQPAQLMPSFETTTQKVTPGGFDSNALKNVLKAIGFDFEMSAQAKQTSSKPSIVQEVKKSVPPIPAHVRQTPQIVETPQQIQTIQGRQMNHQVQPPPQPVQVQQQPIPQYFHPYDPYNQTPSVTYPSQTDPVQVQNINTSLGYPMHVPDPSNPGASLLVYQPVSAAGQPQQIYHQHTATLMQHQPVNLHQSQESSRVVLPPQRPDMPEVKKTDKEMRKERLSFLQIELEKLKKQQNEMLRKKRREKDGHKDPLLKKNTILQAGVEEQIREIRLAADKAGGIDTTIDSSGEDEKVDKEDKYDYFDPGKHWCKLCNTISDDLGEFLSHLHGKPHRKAIDPYDRPWTDTNSDKKKKSTDCVSKSLKGSEFLIPITGYFCTLCQAFSGDQMCAEEHCKSYSHNSSYKKHCKKNSSYEKKFKKKKKAAMNLMENGQIETKQEFLEKEVKYVEKPAKESKKKHKHIIEENVWIEKPLKYTDNDISKEKISHIEKKKIKKHRSIEEEPIQDGYTRFVDRREVTRRSREKDIYHDEKPEKKLPRKYSDDYQQPTISMDYVHPSRSIEHVQSSRSIDRERSSHSTERGRMSRSNDLLPRSRDRQQSSRSKDRDQPPLSSDHGRRRQKQWSPGYDEYEQQQQDENRFDKKHDRHSRSRDREKWVERGSRDDGNKKSSADRKDEQNISAGRKIPTPGFGKFSWNSNSRNESNVVFDQIPVDTPVTMKSQENKNMDLNGKSKIAIKITGKTQIYPPRMSAVNPKNTSPGFDKATQDKRASMASELQKKVEALKRENALRAQLSSVTLPAGRNAKQFQPKPNTAAVILGTRSIGKHNTLQFAKNRESLRTKPNLSTAIPTKFSINVANNPPLPKEDKTLHIEADVSPTGTNFPPLPEPPPPGEEDITMGDEDDGANSDASGISMEIASDEE